MTPRIMDKEMIQSLTVLFNIINSKKLFIGLILSSCKRLYELRRYYGMLEGKLAMRFSNMILILLILIKF